LETLASRQEVKLCNDCLPQMSFVVPEATGSKIVEMRRVPNIFAEKLL